MKSNVVVVGGGINGLVAANYLQRSGFRVTLLEVKPQVGGACAVETFEWQGKNLEYPPGAAVLGFMQDFVYKDTGLEKKISVYEPNHPNVVWYEGQKQPCILYEDVAELKKELNEKWGETGNVEGFIEHLETVRNFIVHCYRKAVVPTVQLAEDALGEELVRRWIIGSAWDLMNHYFTSDEAKVFYSIEVTESGPVSLHTPYSAFTIPLLASGTMFGGEWGFVKGGIWQVSQQMNELNIEAGMEVITSARVIETGETKSGHVVTYEHEGQKKTLNCDTILFATDPLTAARILKDDAMVSQVSQKSLLGSSAKLVMLFDKPVVWQDDTGEEDFDSAFKFIISSKSMDDIEDSCRKISAKERDFVPTYFEIYCEGAAMTKLGLNRGYDSISVFFKNMSFDKPADQLESVRKEVESIILSKIVNKEDLIRSILFTPKDLSERFFFPQGNIDHIELCEDQTFFARNFSPDPISNFYQFGNHKNVLYCAAGSYPCGSIGGTAGYICATQLMNRLARTAAGSASR
jgi:phytoene dehydrogenase-like protein